jgi:3-oxoacyl-[acyl-carrier-protein] synthase-3
MNNNAMIKGVSYYHPDNRVDNDYFIEHFKRQGTDITGLLKSTGRNSRYIAKDMDETMLTMGYQAASKVLEETYVKASQLNLIVFASGTPEYITPSNAIKLHDMIGAGQKTAVYDLNSCCAGMLVAFEQVSRVMRNNPNIKYALVVGSEQMNRYSRSTEAISYSNFGDAGCAIVLENVYNTDRGFIDSDFYTNSSNHEKITLPAKGMTSAIHDRDIESDDKLVSWINFDLSGAFFSAKISINEVLFKNNLTKYNIKKYCVSQFSKTNIETICSDLEEDIDKCVFVGDEYGYTGVTSPFLAYAKLLERENLEIGDYIMFWTVGAGTTCVCALYQY